MRYPSTLRPFLLSSATLSLLALSACGSGSAHGTGASGGTGGDGGGGGVAPTGKSGTIAVAQGLVTVPMPGTDTNITASFSDAPVAGITCTSTTAGSCQLSECTGTAGPPPNAPQAGTIVITSPDDGAMLMPGSDGTYMDDGSEQAFWKKPGETVTAKASGGDVPAFNLSVSTPSFLGVTSPSFSGVSQPVPTSQSFTLAWSGSSEGKVALALFSLTGGSITTAITCTFDASAGQGVVPDSLLGKMPKGSGELLADVEVTSTALVGDYVVNLITADSMVEAPVTFE